MSGISKINHVALVVENIDNALKFWQDALGLKLDHVSQVPLENSAVAFLPIGDSEIELVQPTSKDSGIVKYLKSRGPGMHHLCLEVDDIEGMIKKLLDNGVQLINESPVQAENGRKYAFIHPKAATGVLLELYELPQEAGNVFPALETRRLKLRAFTPDDTNYVFEMYKQADLVQWLDHEKMVEESEAKELVNNRIRLFESGLGFRWAITTRDDPKRVVGSCGFFKVRIGTHTVEIGFELHPDDWRQGIISEALTAVINFGFSSASIFPINRMEALVDPGNKASIGLLKKLGFHDEGTRRSFGCWKGDYHDVMIFALLKEEWKI